MPALKILVKNIHIFLSLLPPSLLKPVISCSTWKSHIWHSRFVSPSKLFSKLKPWWPLKCILDDNMLLLIGRQWLPIALRAKSKFLSTTHSQISLCSTLLWPHETSLHSPNPRLSLPSALCTYLKQSSLLPTFALHKPVPLLLQASLISDASSWERSTSTIPPLISTEHLVSSWGSPVQFVRMYFFVYLLFKLSVFLARLWTLWGKNSSGSLSHSRVPKTYHGISTLLLALSKKRLSE